VTRSVLGEKPLGMDMTLVSLFAGVGGFDLGFEHAGFDTIGQCEIDPHAVSVLERHWPTVPKHDDVATLTVSTFGPADVVTFGSPCQDLSVAGKRAGLDGERSGLFLEAVRFIREMLEATNGEYPRWAVWENVPGAFSSADGADFAAVLSLLVGGEVRRPADGWAYAGVAFGPLGAAEWRVLDSQHFGVAQRRRRVFLVYHPGSERAGQVLLEPQGVRGDTPSRRSPGEGITGALTGGAGSSSAGNPDDNRAQAGFLIPEVMPTMRAEGGDAGGGSETVLAFVASDYSTGAYEPADKAEALTTSADRTRAAPIAFALRGREDGATPEVSGDRTNALRGAGGGSSRDYVAFAENSRAELRLEGGDGQVTGALSTGGGKPGQGTPTVATPYAVRRLTPTECERLQGFPDDWTRYTSDGTEVADTHRYRMMGNAVTVSVAHWIAQRLKRAIS